MRARLLKLQLTPTLFDSASVESLAGLIGAHVLKLELTPPLFEMERFESLG